MSSMFDWDGEELANIIWDEAGGSGDHIVPYPDESEEKPSKTYGDHTKEWTQEAANVKPVGHCPLVVATNSHESKEASCSQFDTSGGFPTTGLRSWPNLSLSSVATSDQDQMDQECQEDIGPEILGIQPQRRNESDSSNYGWPNIGNFDDLDRILSNDDPVFGHVNIEKANELWSYPQDVTAKEDCMLDEEQAFPSFRKMSDYPSHSPLDVKASMDDSEDGGKSIAILIDTAGSEMAGRMSALNYDIDGGSVSDPEKSNVDKDSTLRKLLKNQTTPCEKSETRQHETFTDKCPSSGSQLDQFECQFTPQVDKPPTFQVLTQQRRFQGPESSHCRKCTDTVFAPPVDATVSNQFLAMPAFPQYYSGEVNHLEVPSSHETSTFNLSPLNKDPGAPIKGLGMTPQEKIEKLRRRQRMRALAAIQKQQLQFNHQISSNEYPFSPKFSHETQAQLMDGGNAEFDENLRTFNYVDQYSPAGPNNCRTAYMDADKKSVEDTILTHLQDVIAKLDIRTRICIRDSLFRLAQSSTRRRQTGDSSTSNKSSLHRLNVLSEGGLSSPKRSGRLPDVETETNPIDRTVAHFLFHRPLELSGRPPVMTESPLTTELPSLSEVTNLMCSPVEFFSEDLRDDHRSYTSSIFPERNNLKILCTETSENASTCKEVAGDSAMEIESSQ